MCLSRITLFQRETEENRKDKAVGHEPACVKLSTVQLRTRVVEVSKLFLAAVSGATAH